MKKLMMKMIIGERAKRARHSQVCSIENRGYIYIVRANFVLITRKEARTLCLRVCGATPHFTAMVKIPLPGNILVLEFFSIESSLKAISSDYGSNKEY